MTGVNKKDGIKVTAEMTKGSPTTPGTIRLVKGPAT